jgi:hypothetical protein
MLKLLLDNRKRVVRERGGRQTRLPQGEQGGCHIDVSRQPQHGLAQLSDRFAR